MRAKTVCNLSLVTVRLSLMFLLLNVCQETGGFNFDRGYLWEKLLEEGNDLILHSSDVPPPSSKSSDDSGFHQPKKVVFPIPEEVVMNMNSRSFLPDLNLLTDLAFLFLPSGLPASGLLRLSRDLFESEQCVQFVSCEMTRVAHRHDRYLGWMNRFLQDFPFQGEVADRLRQGSLEMLGKLKEKEGAEAKLGFLGAGKEENTGKGDGCTFSCSPINSLTRGLKILSLLHELVRTVKY